MEITNRLLWKMHNEMNSFNGSILGILLKGRIRDFYKDNQIRISTLLDRISNIQLEHYETDEQGNLKTELVDGTSKYILKHGCDKEIVDKLFNDLLDKKVDIKI